MSVRVAPLLPFDPDDVVGDLEGRALLGHAMMLAALIRGRSGDAGRIFLFVVTGMVLRVGQDICLVVRGDLRGQPAQELTKLVLELPRHDGRLLVAQLIGGEAVPLEVLVLESLKKLGDSLLQPYNMIRPCESKAGQGFNRDSAHNKTRSV